MFVRNCFKRNSSFCQGKWVNGTGFWSNKRSPGILHVSHLFLVGGDNFSEISGLRTNVGICFIEKEVSGFKEIVTGGRGLVLIFTGSELKIPWGGFARRVFRSNVRVWDFYGGFEFCELSGFVKFINLFSKVERSFSSNVFMESAIRRVT